MDVGAADGKTWWAAFLQSTASLGGDAGPAGGAPGDDGVPGGGPGWRWPGESALLDYLVESASGCRLARAAGVESEMELAYAGLHQLLQATAEKGQQH
ncbi:hypothetical protein [Kribbella sp. NPDC049584]|uniref:hypothetical protein n=1 Tax=Kribbella sp. NPDC049584 TaxID=3154833 RepID=UPI00344AA5C0